MITVQGYAALALLYAGTGTTVYRGYDNRSNKPVVIKVCSKEYPSPPDLDRIRREYEITKELNIDGILRPVELVPLHKSYALVLEDIGGTALNSIMAEHRIDVLSCIKISLSIARIIGKVHQKGIIHKDIKPSNIIINEETGEVRLTDFSIASHISGEKQEHINPDLLEGTLAYISPEQTGRMNRSIDHRTDLYSLGIVMYEMLTGSLPFSATDPLELIYSHMAVLPRLPQECNNEVPQMLSDIVMKLMSKNAEDRYRSAFGLKYDLEKCLELFNFPGTAERFVLASRDIPTTLQIPEKLYGREQELGLLMNAFARVAAGSKEIIMVSGAPGIGKSVLINELHKPAIGQKGYFVTGKFDQFKRDVPYKALQQAFRELTCQLLSGRTEMVAEWRQAIKAALGPNGRIIIDLIPEMELIIGKQPPLEQLPPAQSQSRFNMVLTEFVRVFAQRQHPLVLFLDDVQWADWATLKLVELLVTAPDMNSLLLVGAYRDNEVGPVHPLKLTIDEISKAGVTIKDVTLSPLSVHGIIELISDTLGCTYSSAENLAGAIVEKTLGNPFFVHQFLRNLYQKKLVYFDPDQYVWTWDINTIRSADITSNVIEFMCNRIKELSRTAQNILTAGACIGNRFEPGFLARVCKTKIADTSTALLEAQKEGLLVPAGSVRLYTSSYTEEDIRITEHWTPYMFLHDRIRQAAYSLLPAENKKKLHYAAATIMLEKMQAEETEDRLFEIVQHLNISSDQLAGRSEKIRLADLNLKAGRKAKTANAYETALQLTTKGLALLEEYPWQDNYELRRDLSMEKSECAYLTGDFGQAEAILSGVLEHVRTDEEKARVYDLKTVSYALVNLMDSVKAGLAGLRLLGISVPENPSKLWIALEFGRAFLRLRGRKAGDLLSLPEMTDPKQKLAIRLIMNTISSAYLTNRELFAFLCLRGFNLTMEYGVTESSPYMLHAYAFALANNFGAFKSAYDFGTAAFALNEKFPSPRMRSKITAMFGFFFSHWRRPLDEGVHMVKKGFRYCVENGDLVFAGYSACTLVIYMLAQGRNIDELMSETQIYEEFVRRSEDQFSIDWFTLRKQFIKGLKGQTNDSCSLSDNKFDEDRAVQDFRKQHNANLLFHYYTWKGLFLYLNNELDKSYSMFNEAVQYTHGVALLPSVGDHLFYHTLVMSALCQLHPGTGCRKIQKALYRNRGKLKKLMFNSPATFRHKYLLVEAEAARLKGKQNKAFDLYSRAISSAGEYGFVQVEAIANELMGRFHFSCKREALGMAYLREACKCYHKWGASAKVRTLSETHGFLDNAGHPRSPSVKEEGATTSDAIRQIDLTTVLQASQAISEEIVLGRLLKETMRMAITNAGARKGFLILEKDGGLFIEAEGYTGREDVELLQSVPLESSRTLSAGIVNYVQRTMETVVLHNASEEGLFVSDPYVSENRSKSILCMPIVRQKKLTGILYLENDILANAFTRDRREVLTMLAAQAAISIENAKLYEDVDRRVHQLQKAEKQIRASLEEKEVLLREIHHRVKNNMQIISSLLRLQSMQLRDKEDSEMLKESQNRIQSMSLIHEKLYESQNLSKVDFALYVSELIQGLTRFYGVNSRKIRLNMDIEDVFIGIDTAIPCGLIINELVTNSLKYAFPDSREGEIKITLHKTNEDKIRLSVSDNGIGIPDDLDIRNAKSLGLQLVTTLSEHQLQGRIDLDRTHGTGFNITFREIKPKKRE